MKTQLLIAATNSGCGKTTFTLGLMRLLRRRGLKVSGFKSGPDYIDPKFHELASGHQSINLDLYMMSREHVRSAYHRYGHGADVCMVEGVMGLFDGSQGMSGSSAELAQELDIPIVLLINAASSAYSVGAIIYGYKNWKPDIHIAGVIFNRVASENHYSFLADAARDAGVESLGYIPRTESLSVPSRHLGLSLEELSRLEAFPDTIADLLERHVNVDRLLEVCKVPFIDDQEPDPQASDTRWRIAVARDDAFNFIYEENIRALERIGQVYYFSPLYDKELMDVDLIYLPGGYPEFYLEMLERNEQIKEQILAHVERGGRILAECGGMMYLCEYITSEDGQRYKMCGVLDAEASMENMKLHLGYRDVFFTNGVHLRGHEFHYSHLVREPKSTSVAQQLGASGKKVDTALYRNGNVLAGYTHLYWAEQDIRCLWD